MLIVATAFECAAVAADDANANVPEASFIKQLQALDLREAKGFTIFRDPGFTEKLELRPEPVYTWTNPIYRQNGSVFIWTWKGRPELIGSMYSRPVQAQGKRVVVHEFHSLSTAVLIPKRDGENQWEPRGALKRLPVPDAPKPADSARMRQLQMRDLANGFAAHTEKNDRTWNLRLLPRPLFRYQSTDPEIVDGALYAFVTSAGTDPEILLLIEVVKIHNDSAFHYAIGRFSDQNLYVQYHDKEIWSSVRGSNRANEDDALELYRAYRDRQIDEISRTDRPEPTDK